MGSIRMAADGMVLSLRLSLIVCAGSPQMRSERSSGCRRISSTWSRGTCPARPGSKTSIPPSHKGSVSGRKATPQTDRPACVHPLGCVCVSVFQEGHDRDWFLPGEKGGDVGEDVPEIKDLTLEDNAKDADKDKGTWRAADGWMGMSEALRMDGWMDVSASGPGLVVQENFINENKVGAHTPCPPPRLTLSCAHPSICHVRTTFPTSTALRMSTTSWTR